METQKLTQKIHKTQKFLKEIFVVQNKKYIKKNRKLQMEDVFHFMCHKQGSCLSYNRCNFNISKHFNKCKKIASNTAFIKKINKWDLSDIELIGHTFNKHIYVDNNNIRFLACDGTDLNLVKLIKEDGSSYVLSKSKQYKKGFISGIIDVDLKTVISSEMSESQNERELVMKQLKYLNKNDVIIFDAGYYSEELLKKLVELEIGFIFRLPCSNLFSKNLTKQNKDDMITTFKISKNENINVRALQYQLTSSNELCKTRNVKNLHNVEDYFILTSLTDSNEYTLEKIKTLYHKRWNVETYFRQLKYCTAYDRVNYKSIKMVQKMLAVNSFLFSFVAYFEHILTEVFQINKLKKINKKISLSELSFEFLYILLKKTLTKANLKFMTDVITLITKFLMPIQNNRHYRRVTKRPINGWSNMGSIFK